MRCRQLWWGAGAAVAAGTLAFSQPVPAIAAGPPSAARGQSPAQPGVLSAVSATSDHEAWAVGDNESRPLRALALHWDGKRWRSVGTPDRGKRSYLNDVVTLNAHDAWAVGAYERRDGLGGPLVEHWNGRSWRLVSAPRPQALFVNFVSVSALTPTDIWLVGYAWHDDGSFSNVTEHWDGSRWSLVPSWTDPRRGGTLAAVEVISHRDVWTAGSTGEGLTSTLVEHWDGTSWHHVSSPNPGGPDAFNDLYGLTAVSASDVWAVGGYTTAKSDGLTLALHWDGHRWSEVSTPSPPGSSDSLVNVYRRTASDIWAVGGTGDAALIEHWDGQAWHRSSTPDPRHKEISDVAVVGKDDVWAVGSDYWANRVVIEHWDGSGWG